MRALLLFLASLSLLPWIASAATVEYDLEIAETRWSPDGVLRPVRALTVNGSLPGPTLRFRVGDVAVVRVHNRLEREDTSIHWHGLLLPNEQDGVPYVTTPPIRPGTTHRFEFPLKHAGTYWYHSHTGLQEQSGIFGSIVVEPRGGVAEAADRDEVIVLSDWTLEDPGEVMRTLVSGNDWYEFKKGSLQSVAGAIRAGELGSFFEREKSRMPAMDISDVAYDAFLANGKRAFDPGVPNGKTARLRFINAGASTYFYLQSAAGPLQIVAADGPSVKPIRVNRLLMGMAETYDVLVTVPPEGRWEVRATAQDGSGHASVWLGQGEEHPAPEIPRANLYNMDDHLLAALDEDHLHVPATDAAALAAEPERPLSPYARLRSTGSTRLDASLPRRTIELRLTGDMERYIWSFNGKSMAEDGVIKIARGEVLRLEFINDTMMHHPLHLHGHFFRVLDERDLPDAPLKHTIDVPPMSKRTVEFEADESGDWLFHCHLLYHMHAGMARIFSYEEQGPGHVPDLGEHGHDHLYFIAAGSFQSHLSMGTASFRNARNDYFATWDLGWEDFDLDHTQYEIDLGWKRYFGPNFSTVLGARLSNEFPATDRAFGGVEYRLPYLVESFAQVDSEGDFRFGLGKSLQLTNRLSIFGEIEYDTGSEWEWSGGLEYLLTKQFSLISEYHSDYGIGGGVSFRY
ncbi:MAG: multicopper oxidase domain-containing protein [Verrucomicrobiaceae bacterium]|nr:multicopper oxidase domain-containing protein [Verrucomicrobiaceae bacterium]